MNKTSLLMVLIVAAIGMLSAGLAVVPSTMQQASANIIVTDEEDGGDTS